MSSNALIVLSVFAVVSALAFYVRRVAWNVRHKSFAALYERSVLEVVEVLETAGVTYFFVEGTLIWQLRYGTNHPDDIDDVVDDDIDVMIEVATAEEWERASEDIARRLEALGWTGRNRRSTSKQTGRRIDKLQLFRRGLPLQTTHVDLHSYVRDEERGVGVAHGDVSAYPFQRWGGSLPLSLVHPMGKGACYGRQIPCVLDPVSLLADWHNGEYAGAPIELPLRPLAPGEREVLARHARRLDAAGFKSFAAQHEGARKSNE
jgi:hypothetical protein